MRLTLLLVFAWSSVTFDVSTTYFGLRLPQIYETNPFGFNPLLEYLFIFAFVIMLYSLTKYLSKSSGSDRIFGLGYVTSFGFALLPYIASLNNIYVIHGAI